MQLVGGKLLVRLVHQLARRHIDHVGCRHRAIKLAGFNLNHCDLSRSQSFHDARPDLLAGHANLVRTILRRGRRTGTEKVGELTIFGNLPG